MLPSSVARSIDCDVVPFEQLIVSWERLRLSLFARNRGQSMCVRWVHCRYQVSEGDGGIQGQEGRRGLRGRGRERGRERLMTKTRSRHTTKEKGGLPYISRDGDPSVGSTCIAALSCAASRGHWPAPLSWSLQSRCLFWTLYLSWSLSVIDFAQNSSACGSALVQQ